MVFPSSHCGPRVVSFPETRNVLQVFLCKLRDKVKLHATTTCFACLLGSQHRAARIGMVTVQTTQRPEHRQKKVKLHHLSARIPVRKEWLA